MASPGCSCGFMVFDIDEIHGDFAGMVTHFDLDGAVIPTTQRKLRGLPEGEHLFLSSCWAVVRCVRPFEVRSEMRGSALSSLGLGMFLKISILGIEFPRSRCS